MDALGSALGLFIAVLILAIFYLIPTIIAFKKNRSNKMAILALNLFAGWTFVGYIVALVWALTNETTSGNSKY